MEKDTKKEVVKEAEKEVEKVGERDEEGGRVRDGGTLADSAMALEMVPMPPCMYAHTPSLPALSPMT